MTNNMKNKTISIFALIILVITMLVQLHVPAHADSSSIQIPSPTPGGGEFGSSIQKLANGFAVGEPFANSNSGIVHIFDSTGAFSHTISASSGEEFGYSLGANLHNLVVGAPGFNNDEGRVYLYDSSGSSTPIPISNPFPEPNDRMGEDEINFINGNILVGVSKANNDNKPDSGIIYKFDTSGAHTGSISTPDSDGISPNDLFGRSISVEGTKILTGSPGKTPSESGRAYVIDGLSSITFSNPNTIGDTNNDRYGWSTAITSSSFVVSAPNADATVALLDQGIVYLYPKTGTDLGGVANSPDQSDTDVTDEFGYDLAASGERVIVGAPSDDFDGYEDAGSIHIVDNGVVATTIRNPDPTNGGRFGYSVEILDTGTIMVGAPGNDNDNGMVYLIAPGAQYSATLDIDASPNPVPAGFELTILYTITNTGSNSLTSLSGLVEDLIHIEDPNCSSITGPLSDDNGELDPGEGWEYICITQAPAASYTEMVDEEQTRIEYTPNGSDVVTLTCLDEDFICNTVDVIIGIPGISLEISASPNPVNKDSTSTITFTVTNVGDFNLFIHPNDPDTGITVLNPECEQTMSEVEITLIPGSSFDFTCTVTGGTTSPLVIQATVTAEGEHNNSISDTQIFELQVIDPEITLEIIPSQNPLVLGVPAIITYQITNTGTGVVTIDEITETNPLCTLSGPFGQTLDDGESVSFECGITPTTPSPIALSAEVLAHDVNNNQVSATAALELTVISSSIELEIIPTPSPVNFGDSSTIIYRVTNTGSGTLTIDEITETNPLCTLSGPFGQTLDEGNSLDYECIVTPTNGNSITLNGQVTAHDVNLNEINDDTTTTLNVALLALEILSAPPFPPLGSTPSATFEVANIGSVAFDTISVIEDQNAGCTPFGDGGPLPLGTSTVFACTIPSVTADYILHGIATGTYVGGQFIVEQTITVDVQDQLFCNRPQTDFDQVITGTAGNDRIKGGNGDDLIFGLDGNDDIKGNGGDDCIFAGKGNDKVSGGDGNDTIEGNEGNDQIHGQDGNDALVGNVGNDKMWGGDGNDTIEGNEGNDRLHGQDGNDVLVGGSGDDKMWGGDGNDTIEGNEGNDRLHGQTGNDALIGGSGDDKIFGGKGNDTIDAGTGNDTVHANQDNDNITGGDGNDWLGAGNGNDTVSGGAGNDKIYGRQGHDALNGNDGDDIIHGGAGNDDIDGGANSDKCYGGSGNDDTVNCEYEDKKMKEENDDDEGEREPQDDDN
jgi:Ca2+-binding RTX toxin-like protein